MATKPVVRNLNATSVGIINWVLAEESGYLAGAPLVENTEQSIKQVGEFINAYQGRQNQFLSALVNRIALVIISSKAYSNPWKFVKRGTLDAGEAIEEIYVNMAKVENFKPNEATNGFLADLYSKRKPDVKAAFHQMNFQKKYPVSVSEEQLRAAFNPMDGITKLIDYIVMSLYTAFVYDEFLMYKYILYRLALDGKMYAKTIPSVTATNAKSIVSIIKTLSNDLTFMKTAYNMAGVYTHTPKADQMVIKSTDFDAIIDVEVLASAFNIDRVTFAGQNILIDSFGNDELARLKELLNIDTVFTSEEIDEIGKIKGFIVDREFLMQYDKLVKMTEVQGANDLSWNYFLHHWACFSASPFKNAIVLTTSSSAIDSVTVSPSQATVAPGASIALTATVEASGIVDTDVVWKADGNGHIDRAGILVVDPDGSGQITVTATSVVDNSKKGTATITVG